MPASPLLIADVPWLLYRAFYALPKSIKDDEGHPVGALLGTVNMLLAATEACSPRAVVACLGAEQAAYRAKLYPPYHAHRPPMPADLRWQWARVAPLLEGFGWTVSSSEELEADDVMFSYARLEVSSGGSALLLSGDRDMFQAVGEHVAILELRGRGKSVRIGREQVIERYGVAPELVADFIALRGDPSDGLPGAAGIGAKRAAQLLEQHGSLERLLAVAESEPAALSPRLRAALCEQAAQLLAFKQIATLVPIQAQRPPDRPSDFTGGAQAARRYGMRRLAERVERLAKA